MSKGLSWRQKWMLRSILHATRALPEDLRWQPIAWKAIDYGPSKRKRAFNVGGERNLARAKRRALTSLERRGLVELGNYVFLPLADSVGFLGPKTEWCYCDPKHHIPGKSRIVTGVNLTTDGMKIAEAEEAAVADRRTATTALERD
jgi:hypothetical protein